MKQQWNHTGRYCWQLPGQVVQAHAVAVIGVEHFRVCFISDNDNRSCGTRRKFLWSAVHLCFFSFLNTALITPSLRAQVQCYQLPILLELWLQHEPVYLFLCIYFHRDACHAPCKPSHLCVHRVCMCRKLVSVSWSVRSFCLFVELNMEGADVRSLKCRACFQNIE